MLGSFVVFAGFGGNPSVDSWDLNRPLFIKSHHRSLKTISKDSQEADEEMGIGRQLPGWVSFP